MSVRTSNSFYKRRPVADAHLAGAGVYVSGTAYAGMADASSAIQSAITACADYDETAWLPPGEYRLDAGITTTIPLDFRYASFKINGDVATPAITVGTTSATTRYKDFHFPRMTNSGKPTTGWDSGTVGIKVQNMYDGDFHIPYIYGFETGLWLTANGALGTEHARFHLGTFLDNKRGIRVAPIDTTTYAYANEIKYFGGNFAHSTAERSAGPTWYQTGVSHILIDESAETIVSVRTATGGTTSTLEDTGATGTLNQYAGRRIRITGGTGSGQSRIISSHDAGVGITFTMSSNWATAPDATSTYVIEAYARTNGHRWFGPSFQGDVCEYHVDFQSAHQCAIYEARYETHQPGTVLPKVRFTGPFTTENKLMFGYDLDAATITETNGASINHVMHERGAWLRGMADGALTLQNESSNSTGALYVVPAGTALSDDQTSIYTTRIASAEVAFKATADANDRIEIVPSTGRINFGPGSTATDAGLEWVSAGKIGTQSGDSWYVASELEVDGALNHDGSTVGFYGTAPAAKPTVTGSRGANAALASLCTALATLGIITDSTS